MSLEKILKEFEYGIDCDNFIRREDKDQSSPTLINGRKNLLYCSAYPESEYELDIDKIREFIKKAYRQGYKDGAATCGEHK